MKFEINQKSMSFKNNVISGVAAPYESLSKDLGGFREIIQRGAFEEVLKTNPEVYAVVSHSMESDKVLASTKGGTLRLRSTDKGLEFDMDVAPTQAGKDILELIRRGDLSKMSFAFTTGKGQDTWNNIGGQTIRTITGFKSLSDISIVINPAYDDTQVK